MASELITDVLEACMNKKYSICLGVLLVFFSLTANAQQNGYKGPGAAVTVQQSGYKGPGAAAMTVVEAKKLSDDSPVMLRGKIERFLGDEKYLFSDSSGNIVIEIEKEIWGALSVDQNDLVEIAGEIDRDYLKMGVEVEVKNIKKIN